MTWNQVLVNTTGVCLAFLVPFVVFVVVVIVKKIKPTPVVVASGLGLTLFIGVLIVLPMDPRSRQYSWLNVVAISLFLGLLGFFGFLAYYHLGKAMNFPQFKRRGKDPESLVDSIKTKSSGKKEDNSTKT